MKIEYEFGIKNIDTLLLVEIKERVENAIRHLDNLEQKNIEVLKIDRESLDNYGSYLSENLSKKIDFIINLKENG
jgi:hypothetical protein